MNSRLDLLFPQRPTKNNHNPQPITFETLEEQPQNFFLIGIDAKNPWSAQSHKLGPADVLNLTRSGITIRATPHIGLHWPSNSMYPNMGVTICDYMGNQSLVDYADEPENVKEGQSKHNCALQQYAVLSPYLILNPDVIRSNGYIAAKNFDTHKSLASVHHLAKKRALGDNNVILDSEILEVPWAFAFFQVLIENQDSILQGYDGRQGILDRFVNESGVIVRTEPGNISDISAFLEMKALHGKMIREDFVFPVSGYFPIKEATIMFDACQCYWRQFNQSIHGAGIGDTYTTSGVDMINYTKSPPLRAVLDRMYKALLNSGKFDWLPKYIAHSVLPGGAFRFLPCNAEHELVGAVLNLFDAYSEKLALNAELAVVDQFDSNEKSRLLILSKELVNPKFNLARQAFKLAMSRRRGFSQYDLLNGEYVPQEIIDKLMEMTFEQIQTLFKVE